MEKRSQLIVVDAMILPDVFTKVLEVKKLMAQKGEKSITPDGQPIEGTVIPYSTGRHVVEVVM